MIMNEKWFALSAADVENKLKTNAASGLSRKAARSRYNKSNGFLFVRRRESVPRMFGDMVSDISLMILAVMCVVSFCFREYTTATTLILILIANLGVSFVGYYRSQRFSESLEGFYLPSMSVVREGKLYSVNCDGIVEGDVVILREGDIACCDIRLVTSDSLRVRMLTDADGGYTELEKTAEGCVSDGENDALKYCNIVHAGSVVLGGSGRGIAVAVGTYTYIGAKTGGIHVGDENVKGMPTALKLLKKYCSAVNMFSLLIILPFTALSMLISKGNLSLFTTFMTALSVSASSMSQYAGTVCRIFFTAQMKNCVTSTKKPAVIRSANAADRLAEVRYAFVVDGSPITDGVLRLDAVFCADGEVNNFENPGESARKLSELAILYRDSQRFALSAGASAHDKYDAGIREFISKMNADGDALKIRCRVNGFSAANSKDPHDRLFYTDMNEKYVMSVSFSPEILSGCKSMLFGGSVLPLGESAGIELLRRYNSYVKSGKRVLIFSYSTHAGYSSFGDECFVGMLVFTETADNNARLFTDRLAAYGVRPVFFRNIQTDAGDSDISRIPPTFAFSSEASVSDFRKGGKPITYDFGKIDCYDGFSDKEICKLIDCVHEKHQKVAVIGFSDKFEKIYDAADVFVTCSSFEYKVKNKFGNEIEVLSDASDPSRRDCPQIIKQNSDIIIPRPDKKGGGMASFVNAVASVSGACGNIFAFFKYLICVQFVRAVLVMIPMLFGSDALDARHILFCGMIIDLFVLFRSATIKRSGGRGRRYENMMRDFASPIYSNAGFIISFSAGSLFAALLPEVMAFLPFAPSYLCKTEYLFITMILLHFTAYRRILCVVKKPPKREIPDIKNLLETIRPERPALVFAGGVLLLLVLMFASDKLGVLFGIRKISLFYLCLCPLPSVLSEVLVHFFGNLEIGSKE